MSPKYTSTGFILTPYHRKPTQTDSSALNDNFHLHIHRYSVTHLLLLCIDNFHLYIHPNTHLGSISGPDRGSRLCPPVSPPSVLSVSHSPFYPQPSLGKRSVIPTPKIFLPSIPPLLLFALEQGNCPFRSEGPQVNNLCRRYPSATSHPPSFSLASSYLNLNHVCVNFAVWYI